MIFFRHMPLPPRCSSAPPPLPPNEKPSLTARLMYSQLRVYCTLSVCGLPISSRSC